MPPILEPLGTQDHKKSRKTGTQKNTENWIQKVSHFDLKNEVLFRTENVPKIIKVQDIVQMGLQASKMSPRGSKIIKK